ncbi:MAG TPA: TlyA family RNA methyltransferase [Caldilineae bacterium]|nr:TlyA family RNA methyltransferase [Caldilineae bacterium]
MPKTRLDQLLVHRQLCESREQARRLIMAGAVLVGGEPATKPGHKYADDVAIRLKEKLRFVSRGGYKLEAALDHFAIDPTGWICADLGASTGGFTDVLLQRGAVKVYAVDVGYGQLHWKLRQDQRVVVMERTNARYLQQLPDPVHLVTIDASFISLRLLLEPARRLLTPTGQIVALLKPQFEAGRSQVGKGGVIRDVRVHRQVLEDVLTWCEQHAMSPQGLIPSPILGPKGNREFLLWLWPGQPTGVPPDLIERALNLIAPAPQS